MCIVYCKCLTDIAWTDISRGPTHVARCHFGIPAVSGIWCVKRFPSGSSVRKDWLSVQVLERSGEALLLLQPRESALQWAVNMPLQKKKQTKGPVSVSVYIFSPFNCNFSFLQINTLDQSSCHFLSIFMWYRQHQETKTACFTWQNTHSEGTLIFFQTNIFQYFCYCISF